MEKGIRVLASVLVVIMVTSVILGLVACSQPSATSLSSATPESSPTETAATQSRVLKFATFENPGMYNYAPVYLAFKRAIEERSSGRLSIQYYHNGALVANQDIGDAMGRGVVDMGTCTDSYQPEKYVMTQAFGLPPLWTNMTEPSVAFRAIMDDPKYGFQDDVAKINIRRVAYYILPPYQLYSPNKPAYKIEDLKGWRIRSNSKQTTEFYTRLNSLPMSVVATEVAEAMQKGSLDAGVGRPGNTFVPMGWYEFANPGYVMDVGGSPSALMTWGINKQLYDGLAPDLQEIIDEESWNYLGYTYYACWDANDALAKAKMAARGIEWVTWPDSEVQRVRALMANMWDDWAKARDAEGRPGSELVAYIRQHYTIK